MIWLAGQLWPAALLSLVLGFVVTWFTVVRPRESVMAARVEKPRRSRQRGRNEVATDVDDETDDETDVWEDDAAPAATAARANDRVDGRGEVRRDERGAERGVDRDAEGGEPIVRRGVGHAMTSSASDGSDDARDDIPARGAGSTRAVPTPDVPTQAAPAPAAARTGSHPASLPADADADGAAADESPTRASEPDTIADDEPGSPRPPRAAGVGSAFAPRVEE